MSDLNENSGKQETSAADRPAAGEQPAKSEKPGVIPPPPVIRPENERSGFGALMYRLFSSVKVRYKIAITLVLVLSLAVLSLGVVTFTRQNTILRNELNSRAAILVQQLASVGKEGLLTKEELPVVSAISDIQKRDDVVYAMITDNEGRVFAHSDFSRKGTVLTDHAGLAALKSGALLFQETTVNNGSVLDAAIPIIMKTNNLKIGIARVGLSRKALEGSIREQKIIYLWVALAFVAVGLIVSFRLARRITKPLESLEAGIQVVARGDLRKLVAVPSDDEIGSLTNAFNEMILSLREKLLMEKYLSQSTVLSIKENRDVTQLKLGGERKYVTALFSDARGFTSLAEKMSPEDVVGLMNIYLNLQTTVIHHWGGIVDKFVGDEVMAIFEGNGMEINAARAAVEIQSYCSGLNEARSAAGEQTISIGIGLNSGEVVMGNMGSEDHMDYTVIGDNINIAARLCGVAQPGQVLVSDATAKKIGDQATWKELSPVLVKGRDHPISIAEALAVKGGARRYMRKTTDTHVTYTLEGFSDETNSAVVKNIGPGGCLLQVNGPIAIGSKLNINFNMIAVGHITVRASVYHGRKQDGVYYVGLCFENLPEQAKNDMLYWIHRVNSEIAEGLFL